MDGTNDKPTRQKPLDALGVVETIAILRHLRWGYARYGLMWLIIGAGVIFLEPRAAALGDTFVWICSLAAWGAILWGTLAFVTAIFRSDEWLLEDWTRRRERAVCHG
jgi:hypothetical protein